MFIGEGGSFLMPEAVRTGKTGVNPGTKIQGKEATGAFAFRNIKLKAGEKTGYIMLAGVTTQKDTIESRTSLYRTKVNVIKCFEKTKKHWKDPSSLIYVEAGLLSFVNKYESYGISSIAFPKLGCGNGGLDWEVVKPVMERYLKELPIDVYIYV